MTSLLRWAAVLGGLMPVVSASAESGPLDTGSMEPDAGPECERGDPPVEPAPGDVPANWPFFTFQLHGSRFGGGVTLVRASDGVAVPIVAIDDWVVPLEDLIEGEECDLRHPFCPSIDTPTTRHRAVAPIAEPATLGTIEVSQLYAANRARGVSNRYYFAHIHVTEDPGFLVEPWVRNRQTAAEIDGMLFEPSPVASRPSSLYVRVACGDMTGTAPGLHDFRAVSYHVPERLRFATAVLTHTIEPCEAALRVDPDTLRPLTRDEILYWDTIPGPPPTFDAGTHAGLDAGGLDGGRMDMPTARDTETGCNCITTGTRRRESVAASGGALLVMTVLLLHRTSRRLRRGS